MYIRLDALLAVLSFANGPQPLYIAKGAFAPNSIWINETMRKDDGYASCLLYDLNEQFTSQMSQPWAQLLYQMKGRTGDFYEMFMNDMQEFVGRVPPDLWFPDKQKKVASKPKKHRLPPFDNVFQHLMDSNQTVQDAVDAYYDEYRNLHGAID